MKEKIILFIIILIAIFFRFYNISSIPSHPSLDEVSIGYNAYSILNTGSDEFGNKFPILLRAYDDWRPALYVYFVIPFVKLLNLNILAVRLPSIALSVVTVVISYYLVKELLSKSKDFLSISIPLAASFLLAISPWHIYLSRLGHEANLGLSFFVTSLFFFIRFINRVGSKRTNYNLIFSSIFLSLSFVSYQSEKIFLPLLVIAASILFYKKILSNKKKLITAFIIGFILVFPMLKESLGPNGLIRFQGTNIFNSSDVKDVSAQRILIDNQNQDILGKIFDNRRLGYVSLVSRSYLSHFNPVWLFTNSGKEDFKIPDFGLFYLIELPFFALGLFFILTKGIVDIKFRILLGLWGLISVVPGAITTGYPHAMRIYNLLPLPQFIGAIGLSFLILSILKIKNSKLKYISHSFLSIIFLFSILWFYHSYFVNFKRELSYQFQYGVLQSFSFSEKNLGKYNNIVVSNQKNLRQSYMYYLFFKKYDPNLYLGSGGTVSGWFEKEHIIGKYTFLNPVNYEDEKKTLFIVNPGETPSLSNKIMVIKYPDGRDAIWIAETN